MANHVSISAFSIAFFFLSFLFGSSHATDVGVYWGQSRQERSILDACTTSNTTNYKYITIAFLSSFGSGRPPHLNLSHCNPIAGGCTYLGAEIKSCQSQGIKVFLSLGGSGGGTYSLSSADDAKNVAAYLWNHYLGGQSTSRPLGDAVLDGIDFNIIAAGSNLYWDVLAQALKNYSSEVVLAASPQCVYPDYYLNATIATGLCDYLWVQFYNNSKCQYTPGAGGIQLLLDSWEEWSGVTNGLVFLKLPAAPEATEGGGYIDPDDLISKILAVISSSPKYGGVVLWNRYYDEINGYSDALNPNLKIHLLEASF